MPESFETKIARELYYEQMERYRNLNDSLDLPAAVIPLYFLAILFFADQLCSSSSHQWQFSLKCVAYVGLLVTTTLLTVLIGCATFLYCRAVWHYQDATVLPAPAEIEAWLRVESARLPDDSSIDLETAVDRSFSQDYFTAADSTFQQNESRSRHMFYCRRLLIVSLVLTAIAMLGYHFSR